MASNLLAMASNLYRFFGGVPKPENRMARQELHGRQVLGLDCRFCRTTCGPLPVDDVTDK